MGFAADAARDAGFSVIDGNQEIAPAVPSDTQALLIKVQVNNAGSRAYLSKGPTTGAKAVSDLFPLNDPRTGKRQATWGSLDPCVYAPDKPTYAEHPDGCLDSGLIFGGALPWETNMLSLSDMAKSQSWTMTPSLDEIQSAIKALGDPKRVVISIYFRNPYVLDDDSGVKQAGALLATFGVSDRAQLDIIAGKARPMGRLPFALPATSKAILEQHSDAPGYADTQDSAVYPFGFGLAF